MVSMQLKARADALNRIRHSGRSSAAFGNHVTITGANVSLAPVELMSLQGSTNKIRLPKLLVSDDIVVNDTGIPTID